MRYMNVLILSAGRRVELLLGLQAASRNLLPGSSVFAADMFPNRSAACRLADDSFTVPSVADPSYVERLAELCKRKRIGLVVPTIDTELLVLSQNREAFREFGTELLVSDTSLVSLCRDKRRTGDLFERIGISTPEVYDVSEIRFPCFTKFYDGSSSIGTAKLESELDLTAAMKGESRRIFMELVPPEYNEFTIDIYYDRKSSLKALIPRQRLEVRSGEVSKGITRRNWVYDYLLSRVGAITGAVGCLTLQLFAGPSEGDVYAIEINPRFGGGFPLTLAAGADFPGWLIREYLLGESLPFFDTWESNLLMLRYDAKVLVHNYGDDKSVS